MKIVASLFTVLDINCSSGDAVDSSLVTYGIRGVKLMLLLICIIQSQTVCDKRNDYRELCLSIYCLYVKPVYLCIYFLAVCLARVKWSSSRFISRAIQSLGCLIDWRSWHEERPYSMGRLRRLSTISTRSVSLLNELIKLNVYVKP
jgi:hypothetical protein